MAKVKVRVPLPDDGRTQIEVGINERWVAIRCNETVSVDEDVYEVLVNSGVIRPEGGNT